MFYIIYTSRAEKLMNDQKLLEILHESRKWNVSHSLTGMLLYVEGQLTNQFLGRFIQVIEGKEKEVKLIFEKIKNDRRHVDPTIMQQGKISKRNFDKWSMGFKSISVSDYQELPVFFELDHNFLEAKQRRKFNPALIYLRSFYNMHKTN